MQHEKKQKAETDQLLWRTIAGGRQKVWYWVLQEISQYDRPTIGATLAKFDNLFHKWKRIFLPGTGRPPRPLEIQYFCHILNWKLKKNESMKAFWAFEPANSILCQLLHLKQNTNSQLLSSKLALWPLTACVSLGHIFPQNRNTVWF